LAQLDQTLNNELAGLSHDDQNGEKGEKIKK